MTKFSLKQQNIIFCLLFLLHQHTNFSNPNQYYYINISIAIEKIYSLVLNKYLFNRS
jgi:hypothetical protein